MGEGSSVHGALRGAAWGQWREEVGQGGQGAKTLPVKEDVMKLPGEDMTTLGRWPAWDNFMLVTCDKCDKNVKLEAFESHVAMRHGTKSERSAYHRVTAARAAALLSCAVRLTSGGDLSPKHSQLLERLEAPPQYSSNSGSSLGSAGPTSPQPPGLVESSTTSPVRTPPPPPAPEEEAMETSPSPPPLPSPPAPQHTTHKQQKPPFRTGQDEADSTTNNVISIPDTADMPNIEIISDGLDLLDTKFTFPPTAPPKEPPPPPSLPPAPIARVVRPPPPPRPPAPEPMEVEAAPPSLMAPSHPTHYITVSPLSKTGAGSPKKLVIGRLAAAPVEKKLSGREREYDPNRHCGVWDSEQKRNCTRSLTCKSHSVYLKRKVINRTGPFDELLAQHKAEKEATTVRSSSAASTGSEALVEARSGLVAEPTSILERRLKLSSGGGVVVKAEGRGGSTIQVLQPQAKVGGVKEVYCDDSLHYTTDHPKPLAVCTFGGKRIGGLFITDRQRLFTRKVMKLAIGRSVTPIARTQALPYIVNFQSGGLAGLHPGHTIKLASSLPSSQQIVVQETFKFELGPHAVPRQIHQIVPGSAEGAG